MTDIAKVLGLIVEICNSVENHTIFEYLILYFMKYKILAVLHFFGLGFIILLNYYFNSGVVDGKTVGDVSDQFQNLFTPAPYAFAIWGIIYLGLIVFGINLLKVAFNKKDNDKSIISKAAPWLTLANLGN